MIPNVKVKVGKITRAIFLLGKVCPIISQCLLIHLTLKGNKQTLSPTTSKVTPLINLPPKNMTLPMGTTPSSSFSFSILSLVPLLVHYQLILGQSTNQAAQKHLGQMLARAQSNTSSSILVQQTRAW